MDRTQTVQMCDRCTTCHYDARNDITSSHVEKAMSREQMLAAKYTAVVPIEKFLIPDIEKHDRAAFYCEKVPPWPTVTRPLHPFKRTQTLQILASWERLGGVKC